MLDGICPFETREVNLCIKLNRTRDGPQGREVPLSVSMEDRRIYINEMILFFIDLIIYLFVVLVFTKEDLKPNNG